MPHVYLAGHNHHNDAVRIEQAEQKNTIVQKHLGDIGLRGGGGDAGELVPEADESGQLPLFIDNSAD